MKTDFNPTLANGFRLCGKGICIFCQKTIAVLKRANLQSHHERLHPDFSVAYPHSSDLRSQKVQTLLGFTASNPCSTAMLKALAILPRPHSESLGILQKERGCYRGRISQKYIYGLCRIAVFGF